MSIGNLILGVNSVKVSCFSHYDTLLQNLTDIITKCDRSLLQNATEVYYKMGQVSYYKMRQFEYKIRQLLQITTTLLQNAKVIQNATPITNCDSTIVNANFIVGTNT